MSARTRYAVIAAVAVAVVLSAVLGYVSLESRAREKISSKKGAVAIPVSVTPALQQSVPVRLQAIGNVEAYSTVAIKARVDGQIVSLNFKEGQEVRRGAVLFRIDSRPFESALKQAEANALRDTAARNQARSQERRYQELLEKNFVSKEAYAQIATNPQVAEANANASQAVLENARLSLGYCTITSPIDGFVGKVLLQVGNLVKANDVNPLLIINQVRPIYVNFAVPEQSLGEIRKYMSAAPLTVEVSVSGETKPFDQGRLVFVDNAVDPSTGTIRLRGEFDNRQAALWPGQFVNVSLRLFEQTDAIVIPTRALQTGPAGQYVYIVKPDMTAEIRKVAVDRSEGEISVVKGVAKNEHVVTRGALRLAPGTRVQIRSAAETES